MIEREVALRSGVIRYREIGQGPTVVFVHGVLVSGELWRGVAERMSSSCRCIMPDWPLGAHRIPVKPDADLSPPGVAQLVGEFLRALDLKDVTLVGNDSGGAVCQILITRDPARVSRLVLTTCDAFEVFPPTLFLYLRLLAKLAPITWLLLKLLDWLPSLRRLPMAYGSVTAKRIDSALLDRWLAPATTDARIRRDLRKVVSQLEPRFTLEAARALGKVAAPTLVLWSPEDRWFPLSLGRRLVQALPNAELEVVPGTRVFMALDDPAALADRIGRFVARSGRLKDDLSPILRA